MNIEMTSRVIFSFLIIVLLVAGCKSTNEPRLGYANTGIELVAEESWRIADFSNETITSTAAEASLSLFETQLRKRGVSPNISGNMPARYEVSGSILAWHYEGNVSGRPVVAIRVEVLDQLSNEAVWRKTLRSKGKRRVAITALADSLISQMVNSMPIVKSDRGKGQSQTEPLLASAKPTRSNTRDAVEPSDHFLKAGLRTKHSLKGRSTAFYYANNPPVDVLSQYDRIVLEPDNINEGELSQLTANGARAYAYLSVGEVGPTRRYLKDIKPEWLLGTNTTWDSRILDLSNPELRAFLIRQVSLLQSRGYQGLFLDTMDSFNIVAKTDAEKKLQRAGLVALIQEMGRSFPTLKLITNRGFEVLDSIAPLVEAVAAESLYASWNNNTRAYGSVSKGDREWLLGKLNHAKSGLGLDVIVIDYVPPSKRVTAREVAERIVENGFIPWVATPELDYVGVGALEVLPRNVLMIYDSTVDGPLQESKVHKFVAMPVEYMGFVPQYLDLAKESLPSGILKGRYAAIAMWPERAYTAGGLSDWLYRQIEHTVPVAMMGVPPLVFDQRLQNAMGIEVTGRLDVNSARINHQDSYIKPERSINQRIAIVGSAARSIGASNNVHLSYVDKNNNTADMVVTGDFGGFAWKPGVMQIGLELEAIWVVDPFKFLRQALQLPFAPMPDVTTENGRRLWLAHIDGDALPSWAEMPGKRLGAEVISDEIIRPYAMPHSVSIVEAEMTELHDVADRRDEMFSVMREMFKLKNVELASHTYSHPFDWSKLALYREPGRFNLPVHDYQYSPVRETQGSIDFINRELAPANKKTAIMLWSGDALPGAADLAVLDKLGIPNMNGGQTVATYANPSMTRISPMARPVGNYVQVYAPIMNENVYTNNWLGPFDGFKRVIETFEITEKPRRIKPINIYYHFYSGTKIAAVKSLKDIYSWSVKQDIFPLYGSDYSRKVPDFRDAGVARYLSGEWKISRLGNVRSLRVQGGNSWPMLNTSSELVGARQLHDGIYIHTDGSDEVTFQTANRKPAGVHLVSSNAKVAYWNAKPEGLTFRIKGEVPVVLELGGAAVSTCSIRTASQVVKGVISKAKTNTFTFTSKDTGHATLYCPA